MPNDKVLYRVNDRIAEIPTSDTAGFKKAYPEAKEAVRYFVEGKPAVIPLEEEDGFLSAYPSAKKKDEGNEAGFQTLSEVSDIPSPYELTKGKGLDKKQNDATELLLKKNIPNQPSLDRIEFDENALGYDPVFIRDPEVLDEVEKKTDEIITQKKKETTWGTMEDFLQHFRVHPKDIGYDGEVNLERNMSVYEAEKTAELIQTKQRLHFENNPEAYEGAFGQDLRKDSYGLGLIKAVNEGLSMPLLKITESIFNTLDQAYQGPRVAIGQALGKEDTEFIKRKLPLVTDSYDYLEQQSKEWQDMPGDEIVAHVIHGTIHLAELLVEFAGTPEIKILQAARTGKGIKTLAKFGAVNAKKQVIVPKLFTQMAGRNFFTNFSESIETEDYPLLEGLKGAGLGAKDAAIFLTLGYGSGKVAQGVKNLGANATTAGITRATAGGTGFGGYSAIDQLVQHGGIKLRDKDQKIDWDAIDEKLLISDFILGFGLDASHAIGSQKNVPMTLLERSALRYFTSTDATIEKARATKASASELRNKAYELREGTKQHQDPKQIQALRETAAMLDGMADIKAIDAVVSKNPQRFKDIIKADEKIDQQQKEALTNRIDELTASGKLQEKINKEAEKVKKETEATKEPVKKDEPTTKKEKTEKKQVVPDELSITEPKETTKAERNILKTSEKAQSLKIKEGDKEVGSMIIDPDGNVMRVKRIDVESTEQRRGIAKEMYRKLNREAQAEGKSLASDIASKINTESKRIWESLVKSGEAEKLPDGTYKMKTPSDKPPATQQATISSEKGETLPKTKEAVREPKTEPKPKPEQEAATPPKKSTRSVESIAASTKGDFALSLDPKVERLKSQVRDAKFEPKKIRSLIDGFLKENKKAIDEANLSKADLKALNDANTWDKAGKAIQRLTKKIGLDSPKAKAERLKGMISRNKGILEGVPKRVQDAAMKKLSEATLTDAKYRRAVEYLDEVMSRKEYAEYENQRLGTIEKIEKGSAPKKVLSQGARGGKNKKARRWAKLRVSDLSLKERIDHVHDLVRGKWKQNGKTQEQVLEKNFERLEELSKKEQEGVITEAEVRETYRIISQNELLEFGNIRNMSLDQVRAMEKRFESYKTELRTEADKQREQYLEYLTSTIKEHDNILSTPKGDLRASKKIKPPKRTRLLQDTRDASFYSLLNILSRYDMRIYSNAPVFKDALNHIWADRIHLSEGIFEKYLKGTDMKDTDVLKNIFKLKTAGGHDRVMYKMNELKDKTGVFIYEDGVAKKELAFSQFTALEKWLQWKDPDGRRAMEKYNDKYEMGFTEQSIAQLEKFLTPETKKLAEHMIETKNEIALKYDEVYRKINGASFFNQNDFHWTLKRADVEPVETGINSYVNHSQIQQNSTKTRKQGAKPLEYTNAWQTYKNYIDEASRYIAFAEAHRDLSRVFRNPEVKKKILYNFGENAWTDVQFQLDNMAGTLRLDKSEFLDRQFIRMSKGIILANPGPAMKQTVSWMFYTFDPRVNKLALLPRTVKLTSNTTELGNATKAYLLKQALAQYRNNTQTAMGMEIAMSSVKSSTTKGASNIDYLYSYLPVKEIIDVAGYPLKKMDRLPIINTGGVYLQDIYKHYSGKELTVDVLKRGIAGNPDPHLRMATRDWENISVLTQQTTRPLNRSRARSTTLGKGLTFAKSGPGQVKRIAGAAVRDMEKAARTKDWKKFRSATKTWMLAHTLSGIVYEFVDKGFVIDSRDDVKDLAIAGAIGPLGGAAYGILLDFAKAQLAGKWWKEEGIQVNPLVQNLENIYSLGIEIGKESLSPMRDGEIIKNKSIKLAYELAVYGGIPAKGFIDVYDDTKSAITGERSDPARAVLGFKERDKYLSSLPLLQRINIDDVDNQKAIEHLDAYMKINPETGKLIIDTDRIESAIQTWAHLGIDLDYVMQKARRNEDYKWMNNNEKLKGADTKEKILKVMAEHTLNQAEMEVLDRRLEELEGEDPYSSMVEGLEVLDKWRIDEDVEVK